MTYAGFPYGGVGYAGSSVAANPATDTATTLAVEWSPTTGALATPVWVDVTTDVRSWNTSRGRNRELERFQPGRATIVLSNLDRQYDSVYTAGPNYGNIRPMRRIRIRETFNGVTYPVFDGFVDKWKLDYPNVGRDATATVTATDAMKVLARAAVGRSVYANEVTADAPAFWWRLDEGLEEGAEERVALNSGSIGVPGNGTYLGAVDPGAERMVVNDRGKSLQMTDSDITPGTPLSGVDIPSSQINLLSKFNALDPFTLEFWIRPDELSTFGTMLFQQATTPGTSQFYVIWVSGVGNTGQILFVAGAGSVTTAVNTAPQGFIHHVVVRFSPSGASMFVEVWINGVLSQTGTLATGLNTGTINSSAIGHTTSDPANNWVGRISNVAIYLSALSDARIVAHTNGGTAPWKNDLPGARLDRVLTLAAWPTTLRELDAGATTLQSAEISSQSVLDHAQKVGETEYGLLFVTRDGKVRLVSRQAMFDRVPDGTIYGDLTGEVGYTNFEPDDGDDVIRNRAIISRLNGIAQTVEDAASIAAYGPYEYVLDGLLHSSDQYSKDYAQTIVGEYGAQRRRITSLTMGPPISGLESTVYPAMLGPELGDYIRVRSRPVGGGALFEQVCAVEGIVAAGAPGGVRTTRFILSPMLGEEAAMAWTAYTPTLTQSATVTKTLNYAKYARSGNTVFVQLAMTVTGAGTGANAVLIGLPVAAANAASLACWGVGTIYDASANLAYKGVAVVSSSTAASIWASSTSVNALGVADFTAALAVGDIVDLSIMYEAA